MKKVKKKLQAIFNFPLSESRKIKKGKPGNLAGTLIPIPVRIPHEKFFSLIKFFIIIFLVSGFSNMQSQGQIIKKLQKKVEKKVEQRADRKVDKTIDKALDATENEAEKSLQASSENKNEAAENESLSSPANIKTAEVPTTANLAEGLVLVGSDCSDFIWFKEGSMMKFESKDGKGKTMNQSKMVVEKVYKKDGATIADVNMSDDKKNEFTMQF